MAQRRMARRYRHTPASDRNLGKTVQALREAVWRAYFSNDDAFLDKTLRPDFGLLSDPQSVSSKRAEVFTAAKKFAETDTHLISLEFSHTEIRLYEQTAILYADFRYELESSGKHQDPVSGKTTDIFVYRDGKWFQVGWSTI
jgi:Domain of unknown function (DUF4440)